jgi:hypothetical protein
VSGMHVIPSGGLGNLALTLEIKSMGSNPQDPHGLKNSGYLQESFNNYGCYLFGVSLTVRSSSILPGCRSIRQGCCKATDMQTLLQARSCCSQDCWAAGSNLDTSCIMD